jgi:arylsulfatase A
MIVRWPGRIAPGTQTNHLSTHYDFMATLSELVEAHRDRSKEKPFPALKHP